MDRSSKPDKTSRALTESPASQVVSVKAPAKINLYFDILNKRADNYHEILTLFQALDLQDYLTFEFDNADDEDRLAKTEKKNTVEIVLTKNDSIEEVLFPLDKNNSISKAIEIFFSALPNKPMVDIKVKVEKNIPIGAGLAGGSANAAATLMALNHYFNRPFTNNKLKDLAAQIGSDVSFCLAGGLAIGRGRGEQLQELTEHPEYHFILVKPRSISISTPWAYKMYDQFVLAENPVKMQSYSISDILSSLKFESDLEKQAGFFYNAFETVIFKEYPLLLEIKMRLLKLGCLAAHLTGSGPTIYALVKSEEEGKAILKDIKEWSVVDPIMKSAQTNSPVLLDAWLTKSIDHGARILSSESK